MPYKKYTQEYKGHKTFVLKNTQTGTIRHFKTKAKRATGIRLSEAYKHGWKPTR